MRLPDKFFRNRRLETLVENQTSYTLNHAALHVFETHQQAEQVLLQFAQPVLASMLEGKKVMHLEDQDSFEFLPGESLILPSNETMCIDFPEAQSLNPTRCLAMAISEAKIEQVVNLMNERMIKAEGSGAWQMLDYNFHFTNDAAIYQILNRLLYLFTEEHPSKDLFVDNMLQELVVRVLQANQRKVYQEKAKNLSSSNRIAYVVNHMKENFQQSLSVNKLSDMACMSESHFFKVFKNETGLSPTEYLNQLRIEHAADLLNNPNRKINSIFMDCGFENRSYFNRLFKRMKKLSPSQYQKRFGRLRKKVD
jgi:AraC-like DNA-binding protein